MKKNLYYRSVIRRHNVLKEALLTFFFGLSSYPKLLLEVFIRKNFGERYFKFSAVVLAAILFMILPFIIRATSNAITVKLGGYEEGIGDFWLHYATYYLYIIAFLYVSCKRWREVKRNPSVFDFEKFSLYSGDKDERFFSIKLFGKLPDTRRVEILYEPGLYFIPGLFLWIIGQNLGVLLVVCSIIYSLSYVYAYSQGDNFIMDKIDELKMNENLEDSFVNDLDPINTQGVEFRMRKPTSEELRRRVSKSFIEEIDDVAEVR